MSISSSVVAQLLQLFPDRRAQMYFKSSLTALSHAMEDRVLAGEEAPLVIASFQQERFYRQEAHRYKRIAQKTDQVYVLAAPETEFTNSSGIYETIAFAPEDSLAQEWHLVVIASEYSICLICGEKNVAPEGKKVVTTLDANRRFEGIWTFDRQVAEKAANLLLEKILVYRPELKKKIAQAKKLYLQPALNKERSSDHQLDGDSLSSNPDPFVQRLLSYLQAGQYKLIKANKNLAIKQQKEKLINTLTNAIRRSLNTEEILQIAVQKLGEGLGVCRCLIYRCTETDTNIKIEHEFLSPGVTSLKGQNWSLQNNPLFKEVVELREALSINDTSTDPRIIGNSASQEQETEYLKNIVNECSIFSWLLVPVVYQGKLLGMLELHHCGPEHTTWKTEDINLVNAIATQVGVALIQAEAYANLQKLNEELAALDRTRSNLVAITGHELRTPLSTIQVCLESLATEPDMSPELRQVMLNTALADTERMRKLIQDFLTLSQLESGRIEWNIEPVSLQECIELAISNVTATYRIDNVLPEIINGVTSDFPIVEADGEWLVEVLAKLLDNACKFTEAAGNITINAKKDGQMATVTVSDTGRGIEPSVLEQVFDRFYQEEGALRRSAGGTGLGLAICRQIVKGWQGEIWAESTGKNQGSNFSFTIPLYQPDLIAKNSKGKQNKKRTKNYRKKSKKNHN